MEHQTRSVLSVSDLAVHFIAADGATRAVDGVSFDILAGEMLGVVGESGCGKSVTALAVMGLLPERIARIAGGAIFFNGNDLLDLDEKQQRRLRGREISMVFQEPMTSLNPLMRVGEQIAEVLRPAFDRKTARQKAVEALRLVKLPDPEERSDYFPHQFSGGMRQRIMIAMAIASRPRLIIMDEPTTALDVTIQAQILELIRELRTDIEMSGMLITHDLGVVAETCDRVMVMYAGRKVEEAAVEELFGRPAHPYTLGLFNARPQMALDSGQDRLHEIPGMVPSLRAPIAGCAFAPRCAFSSEQCSHQTPIMRPLKGGHSVACHNAERVLSVER